jgi:curli production assembly/transport component CsgG
MLNHPTRFVLLLFWAFLLSACSNALFDSPVADLPHVQPESQTSHLLKALPAAQTKTVVSVYDFQDLTGQLKPNTQFAEYSKAVTQGGLAILNKALMDAGDRRWFTVVERGGLKDLVQERQIIRMMRDQYPGPDGKKLGTLPALLYAGMLIEGGVVGYDSNTITGGAGANYLGIGGDVNYTRDVVTVDLRAVNIATGEIMLSVTTEKTILAMGISGSVFRYVELDHLLQAESGITTNEPPQLAVRKAIQTAVYSLIMEGVRYGYWQFADPKAGQAALHDYLKYIDEEDNYTAVSMTGQVSNLPQPSVRATNAEAENAAPGPSIASGNEKKSLFDNVSDYLSIGPDQENDNKAPLEPAYPVPPVGKGSR